MDYEKTMQLIRRGTYRLRVTQEGGKFIPVQDGNELEAQEKAERKAEFDRIMYDRVNGFSGFDEFNDQDEVADIA